MARVIPDHLSLNVSEAGHLGVAAVPASTPVTATGLDSRIGDIAGRLLCAEEELQAAHRACLDVDEKFEHEVAQLVFAVGAVRLSWRKKHGI